MKYSVNLTKYGTYAIASDVGYSWLLSGEMGEFRGDWTVDRDFEGKRYLYYQKLFNESAPSHDDQRRYEIRTRAGHKFEMRDVGWAQIGGAVSGKEIISGGKTRDEFGPAQTISNNTSNDQRWVKLNSKGGHLIELMDAGFHPNDDKLYSTNLIDDCGATFEDGWENRDARQVRFISRHGFKFVLDDRGSDPVDATGLQTPHGNGWLLKTRRSFDNAGKGVGFGFEANDKDEIDSTKIYTPKSKVFELNDKLNFIMLCTDTKELLPRDWAGVLENEFTLSSVLTQDPEHSTFHLKLDNQNGYLRLKTSVGMDNGLRQFPTPFPDSLTDVSGTAICQGLEARDGRVGNDGPWAEVVDVDNRGMWFSHNYKLGIWRARTGKQEYIAVQDSDGAESIVIYNNNGKVQIYSRGQISIVSESNVVIQAGGTISLNADRVIAKGSINAQEFNGSFIGAQSGSGAGTPSGGAITPESIVQPSKTFPSDRAMSMLQDSPTPEGVIKNT